MTHETTAPVQSLVEDMVACLCGDEYPANSYGAGFIHGSGMCENCDAALPAKDIARQAAPVAVPDENWTPANQQAFAEFMRSHFPNEMESFAIQSLGSAWKDGQANGMRAAPTPPAQQPVQLRFPTMLRKMWSGGEVQAWLDEQGPLYTAPPAQQQNEPQNIPEIIPAPEQTVTATLKHSTKENGDCLSWCKACATEIKQRALLEANK